MNPHDTKGAYRAIFGAYIAMLSELADICADEANWHRNTNPERLELPRSPDDFAEMARRYEVVRKAAQMLRNALNDLIL